MFTTTWSALLLLLAVIYVTLAPSMTVVAAISPRHHSSFAGLHRITSSTTQHQQLYNIRGGDSEEEYDSEEEEYDSDDEVDEPIVIKTKKLASSTKNTVQKKNTSNVKSKVKVALASSSSSSKKVSVSNNNSGRSMYKRYVPYIIRACLNPFTLMRMTKSYFVSLCDINYLKEVRYILCIVFVDFFVHICCVILYLLDYMSYETNTPDPCIFPHNLCEYITIFVTQKRYCVRRINLEY